MKTEPTPEQDAALDAAEAALLKCENESHQHRESYVCTPAWFKKMARLDKARGAAYRHRQVAWEAAFNGGVPYWS